MVKLKREHRNKAFALFIIFTFVFSGIAFAIISAFPVEESRKATVFLNIEGSKDQTEISFKDGETIGNVFTRLNIPFNKTCIFDKCVRSDKVLEFFVNQEKNTEYDGYLLKNDDRILIEYR